MSSLPRQILQTVEVLPTEDQYQVLSFVAQASIGAGEGPGDLSTNPDYMQSYGQ
jgi:hypothetical protein